MAQHNTPNMDTLCTKEATDYLVSKFREHNISTRDINKPFFPLKENNTNSRLCARLWSHTCRAKQSYMLEHESFLQIVFRVKLAVSRYFASAMNCTVLHLVHCAISSSPSTFTTLLLMHDLI